MVYLKKNCWVFWFWSKSDHCKQKFAYISTWSRRNFLCFDARLQLVPIFPLLSFTLLGLLMFLFKDTLILLHFDRSSFSKNKSRRLVKWRLRTITHSSLFIQIVPWWTLTLEATECINTFSSLAKSRQFLTFINICSNKMTNISFMLFREKTTLTEEFHKFRCVNTGKYKHYLLI